MRVDKRREPGGGERHLGIRGGGAVDELREQWVSQKVWRPWVANAVKGHGRGG
jgi:hypothetical protein